MSGPTVEAFRDPYEDRALIAWVHALWAEYRLARGLSLPGGRGDRLFVETQFVPPRMSREGGPVRAEALLREHGRVALTGEGGAGKSFYARALIAGLCTRKATVWKELLGPRVPLPLLPARLGGGEGPEGLALLEHLLRAHPGPAEEIARELPSLLDSGQALVVLDGWDEVDDPRTRERLRAALVELAARHPRVGVLLTSSPGAWEDQPVEGFELVELEPFGPTAEGRELWARLQAVFGAESSAFPVSVHPDGLLPGNLFLRAFLSAAGELNLPQSRVELLERVQFRLVREWAPARGVEFVSPAVRLRWLGEVALRLHRARVWDRPSLRLPTEQAVVEMLQGRDGVGVAKAIARAPVEDEAGMEEQEVSREAGGLSAVRERLRMALREDGPVRRWIQGSDALPPDDEVRAWLGDLSQALDAAVEEGALFGAGSPGPMRWVFNPLLWKDDEVRPVLGMGAVYRGTTGDGPVDMVKAEVPHFVRSGLRPGGLLVEEAGGIGFAHLDHQDVLAADALFRRLCVGWLNPAAVRTLVGEIGRMALRSAGIGAVQALFARLKRELPVLADWLAAEVFRDRAAPRPALRRLARLASRLGYSGMAPLVSVALNMPGEERTGRDLRDVRAPVLWVDAQGEDVDLGRLPPTKGILFLRRARTISGAGACNWEVVTERGRLTMGGGAD